MKTDMKLPERHYLTFHDLCSRWGCPPSDLHHMIANGQVVPTVFLSEKESYPASIWRGGSFVGDVAGAISHIDCHEQFASTEDGPNHWENWPECGPFVYCHHPKGRGPSDYSFLFFSENPDPKETREWFQADRTCLIDDNKVGEARFVFMMPEIRRVESGRDESAEKGAPESQEAGGKLAPKSENSYLNIIGALVGLLLEKKDTKGNSFSTFKSQNELIQAIHDNYGDTAGLSESNLQRKFSEAKKAINAK